MVTTPRLSARHLAQRTASKGDDGSASMAARSSASEPTAGTGTSRLRRMNPTAFSTDPFSLPEYGLQ